MLQRLRLNIKNIFSKSNAKFDKKSLDNFKDVIAFSNTVKRAPCFGCVKPDPIDSIEDMEKGDHIVFSRNKYQHHSIIIDINNELGKWKIKLAEATQTFSLKLGGSFFYGKADYCKTDMDVDNEKRKQISVYNYSKSMKPFEKSIRVKYANKLVELKRKHPGEFNELYKKYNVLNNNCEHFATVCSLGYKFSHQSAKLKTVFKILFPQNAKVFEFIKSIIKMGHKICFGGCLAEEENILLEFYHAELLCHNCYQNNLAFLKRNRTEIYKNEQLRKGDVVAFNYFRFTHYAVVSEVYHLGREKINFKVIHYSKKPFYDAITVREDSLTFNAKHSLVKIHYDNSFPPDKVVETANKQLGKQFYSVFVNDSKRFAHRCKVGSDIN